MAANRRGGRKSKKKKKRLFDWFSGASLKNRPRRKKRVRVVAALFINVFVNNTPSSMMESCLAEMPGRVGPVEVNDIRRDLFPDFSAIPEATQGCVELQKEHLRVYLRIRPFTSSESDSGEAQDCVTIEGSDTAVLRAPRYCLPTRASERPLTHTAQRFTFTQVYGPETSQRQMFEGTVRRLVREVLEGGNSLVFTYGVTNAGKTFTFLGPESDGGLLPRSLAVIFNSIEGRVYSQNLLKPHRCRDFTRLTREQQEEESTSKRNLLRLVKESDCQRSTSSQSSTCRSAFLEGSSLSSDSSVNSASEGDSFCLDVDSNTKFAIWVSFCEIYNENIHDLLEQLPSGTHRRTALRLSQDIKGNSFVKDLRWVQVNSSEEAYKVMKIGKKNQSFSATRLNQLSSRSHSIFSIRILRIEDVGVPRVHTISELSLCDLAGSERCAKTQNRGERLKEAGNINTSLLTLGKCMNALRLNQHAKFQQHVPFRESKLTHYLQGFFCGRGKACMIVNINQCASMYDETLNVLKFSALAQKVVVVNPKPVLPSVASQRSARDVSMIINHVDGNQWGRGRRSSMVAWETSLEDVQEDDDDDDEQDEEEEEEEEESMLEGTVLEAGDEEAGETTAMEEDLEQRSGREAEEKLALESRIREEVTSEFMELFTQMKNDYNERLTNEREIIEERAEKRLEIFKNLVSKSVSECTNISTDQNITKEDKVAVLEGIISTMREDLLRIRKDAEAAQNYLTELPEETHTQSTAELRELKTQLDKLSEQLLTSQQHIQTQSNELEAMRLAKQQSHDQLEETKQSQEQQRQKFSELLEMCHQKEEMIWKLERAMDSTVENTTRDRDLVESVKQELLDLRQNCRCLCKAEEQRTERRDGEEEEGSRKRRADTPQESSGEPATKRMLLEEEIWRLQDENDKKEQTISQLRGEMEERVQRGEEEKRRQEEELLRRREEEVEELRKERTSLEQTVEKLTADLEEQSTDCESLMLSLEAKQRETARLTKENKALVNGIFQLQSSSQTQGTEVTSLQSQLREQTDRSKSLSEQLDATTASLLNLQNQSEEKTKTIDNLNQEVVCLTQEVDGLTQEVKVSTEEEKRSSTFRAMIEELRKESQGALERSAQKSHEIEQLQSVVTQLKEQLSESVSVCSQLREELASHKEESTNQLQSWQAEKGLLMQQLEGLLAQLRASEVTSARGTALEKQLAESEAQRAALRQRLEEMDRAEEERKRGSEKEKEELRLALSQQEESRREQEKLLEDRLTQIEALTQELTSLKDSHLQRRSTEERRSQEEKRSTEEETTVTVVEELRAEIQKMQERKEREGREQEEEKRSREEEERRSKEFECVRREIERLQKLDGEKEDQVRELQEQLSLHTTEVLDTSGGRFPLPEVEIQFSPLRPHTLNLRRRGDNSSVKLKITTTNRRKRKSCEMEDPVQSENKRNRLRGNSRAVLRTPSVNSSPVSVKGKKDGTLQRIGDLIHSSPSILGSKAKTIMGLVSGRSVEKELVATETKAKPKRTKRKLYKKDISSPLLDMPAQPMMGGEEEDEKESDHIIIKRQLRSKTPRQ